MTPTILRSRSVAALAALLFFASACTKEKTPAAGGHSGSGMGEIPADATVATYTGGKVTGAELNAVVGAKVYELRQQAAEQKALEAAVKAEAKKQGITEEQYFKKEIDSKVPTPAEAEVNAFFENAKAQGQIPANVTLEQAHQQVVQEMTQQPRQDVAKAKFAELRKQYNIQLMLPEPVKPRISVEPKGPARGPADAKVTIVEFSDFQCPFCARAYDTVEQVMQAYPGKVRLVFRNFPLNFHPFAQKAAEASACADDQGKFWPYYETLFKNQQKLAVADLKDHAKSLGLDATKFAKCLDSGDKTKSVQVDQEAGTQATVNGTPAFFINGVMLSGALPLEEFKKVIDKELASK